jgi:hypothetical protein
LRRRNDVDVREVHHERTDKWGGFAVSMEALVLLIALTRTDDLVVKLERCASDMWGMAHGTTTMSDQQIEQCAFVMEEAALRLKKKSYSLRPGRPRPLGTLGRILALAGGPQISDLGLDERR